MNSEKKTPAALPASPSLWKESWTKFCKQPVALISLIVFIFIVIVCLAAPLLAEYNYQQLDMTRLCEPPSKDHIFGTDLLGRDMFSRILYGGRVTLRMSFTAVAIAVVLGGAIGLISGFYGGIFDTVAMRVVDGISAIPTLLLAIVFEYAFGFGVGNFMYAMGVALIPPFARLLRSAVLTVVGSEYIEAARALGIGNFEIIVRHVLPNVIAPALIHISNTGAEAVLMCTIINYIGIGLFPPTPEWGAMVNYGYNALRAYPHIALIPCFAVSICVLALNLIGNGLRDALGSSTDHE